MDVMTVCPQGGKRIHYSEGMARAQLRSLQKRKPEYNGRVYPCVACRGFHVGRLKEKAHRNKYAKR